MALENIIFNFIPSEVPPLDLRFINSRGNFHSWCIESLKLISELKRIHRDGESKDGFTVPGRNLMFLTSWCKTEVNFSLYENVQYEYFGCEGLTYTDRIYSRGTKSFVVRWEIQDSKSKKPLIIGYQNYVMADKTTRKTVILPEVIENYCQQNQIPRKSILIDKLKVPETVFEYETIVYPSQIDWLHHLNHCEYNKISSDCGAIAVQNNFYKFFKNDLNHYHIKETVKRQLGECFTGDKLRVITWQDQEKPEKLYFKIFKTETNKEVFELTVIYFRKSVSIAKY